MSYIRGGDRDQVNLLPARIDEHVSPEAAVRVIDAFAGAVDMAGLGFVRAVPAGAGRPGYDPRDLPSCIFMDTSTRYVRAASWNVSAGAMSK